MSLIYKCDNCGATYTPEEYVNLPAILAKEDRSIKTFEVSGRLCTRCGEKIKI